MPQTERPKIFISYCHADISKARRIEADLQGLDFELVRDERSLHYTEDLESYMKRIRATDYALILVSDAFLRSVNCMYEVHEFLKNEDHQRTVLPVILKDYDESGTSKKGAQIYTDEGATEYIRYWQNKEISFRRTLKGIDPSNLQYLSRQLALIQSITKTVSEFIFLLRRIKHVNFDDLILRGYKDVLGKLGYEDLDTATIRRARSYYSQAIAETNLERRVFYLSKAIDIFPQYVDALNKRGQAYDEQQKYTEALKDYDNALAVAPDHAAVHISRSYSLIRLTRYDEALRDLDTAARREPNHKEIYNNRADVYRRLNRFPEAIQDVKRALKIDPDFDLAYATLAEVEAVQGNDEAFFRNIARAVDLGFPLHKYAFDEVYGPFKNDSRFKELVERSVSANQRFI
jgi:tetratricopeptide (TPR) repeat protein